MLACGVGIAVGFVVGLLGAGGGILTIPILLTIFGHSAHQASAESIIIVGVTSLVGMISAALARRVRWGTGLIFALVGIPGTLAGAFLAGAVSGQVLVWSLSALLVVVALSMFWRAAHYKLPLMLAIIGGPTSRFVPFTDLYRRAWEQFGNDGAAEVGYHSYGYVARTDEEAVADFFDYYVETNSRLGRERGWRPPSREAYLYEVKNGALAVGSPETVARKIATGMRELGATRYDLKVSYGSQPHEQNLSSIELFGTEVIPRVKELLAGE
ncbi:TSUP family transporter [Actinotignum timonense]|nr:TSUP family transporter [Actinotignum timonense]